MNEQYFRPEDRDKNVEPLYVPSYPTVPLIREVMVNIHTAQDSSPTGDDEFYDEELEARETVGHNIADKLADALKGYPNSFYELIKACRAGEEKLEKVDYNLAGLNLIDLDGNIYQGTKLAVESFVRGEGLQLYIQHPDGEEFEG